MGLMTTGEATDRKNDFRIQAMGREIKTVGSKSGDAELSRNMIMIKSRMARLRIQVRNIE